MKKFYFASLGNRVFMIIFMLFALFIPIVPILSGEPISLVILFFVLTVFIEYMLIYVAFLQRIYIHRDGVTFRSPFKSYEMNWDDILAIGVCVYTYQSAKTPLIYFLKKEEKDIYSSISDQAISNDLIKVGFRMGVIQEIRKYWDYRIDGLEIVGMDDDDRPAKVSEKSKRKKPKWYRG